MEPIAVIGLGCRFPAAPDPGALWELMCSGRDVLGPAPEGRYLDLAQPAFRDSDTGRKLSALRGGFLHGIDLFDPAAFHISPREARVIDPQQRLLLETAWEALEDAGQDFRRLAGAPVGVFVGAWGSDYQARLFRLSPRIDIAMTSGGGRYAAAGRLSYAFDFRGPSIAIDTACSSSLVSIHMACQSLRSDECSLAIAGGVNVILDPSVTIGYLAAGALSPDGRCKFGDASADGYARSEGAGIVVLKTLSAARAAGDPIHAIIRASAVTHNGQTGGSLLAPGEEGQLALLRQALAAAGLRPADLDYIEAHGTGTPGRRPDGTPGSRHPAPRRRPPDVQPLPGRFHQDQYRAHGIRRRRRRSHQGHPLPEAPGDPSEPAFPSTQSRHPVGRNPAPHRDGTHAARQRRRSGICRRQFLRHHRRFRACHPGGSIRGAGSSSRSRCDRAACASAAPVVRPEPTRPSSIGRRVCQQDSQLARRSSRHRLQRQPPAHPS